MEQILLILVLAAGDQSSGTAAKAIAEALHEQDPKARVLLAPEATKAFSERGLTDADLLNRTDKPLAVTAANTRLVLVRVERRDSGNNHVINVDFWAVGQRDGMTAVAGKDGNPLPSAIEGSRRLLLDTVQDPTGAAERADLALLAPFKERADWTGLIKAVGARSKPSPRLRHAVIMAYLRLGNVDGASAELSQLRTEAPSHALVKEAASMIEAAKNSTGELRDAAVKEDGGNVLR